MSILQDRLKEVAKQKELERKEDSVSDIREILSKIEKEEENQEAIDTIRDIVTDFDERD